MRLCALQVFNFCEWCEKNGSNDDFLYSIPGVLCNLFSALRVAHLIHKSFIHPNIYTSNSFKRRELLLILIKINEISVLCVMKFLFLTRAGDMVKQY